MNNETCYILTSDGELYHYGVKGMKWGVRRYQNKDGSLTPAGKRRAIRKEAKEYRKELYREHNFTRKLAREESKNWEKGQLEEAGIKSLTDKQKKMLKAGATFTVTALAVYGGYKLYKTGKLDGLVYKGRSKTNELMRSFGSTKIDTVAIDRARIDTARINTAPAKKSKIKVSDLSGGTQLLTRMKNDGTNVKRALENNQWMTKSTDELAKNIENMRAVNAKRRSLGMPVDESVLANMELAYLVKRYGY